MLLSKNFYSITQFTKVLAPALDPRSLFRRNMMMNRSQSLGFTTNQNIRKVAITSLTEYQRKPTDQNKHNLVKVVRYSKSDSGDKLNPGEKIVYFIRHGQSAANAAAASNIDVDNPAEGDNYKDAKLTDLGIEQAIYLQQLIKEWGVQIVLASPFRRTLLTSTLVFQKDPVQIIAWPKLIEYYPAGIENRAFKLSENKKDIDALPRSVIFDNVADDWWTYDMSADQGRLQEFVNWLSLCPETRIAVVSHWGFIHGILLLANFREDLSPNNCCPIVMHFGIPSVVKNYPEYRIQLLDAPQHASNLQNPLLKELLEFWEDCRSNPTLQTATELGPLHVTIIDYFPISPAEFEEVRQAVQDIAAQIVSEQAGGFCIKNEEIDVKINTDKALFVRLALNSPLLKQISSKLKSISCCDNQLLRSEFNATIIRDDKPEHQSLQMRMFTPVLEKYPILNAMVNNENSPDWKKYFSSIVWKLCLQSREGEHMAFKLNKNQKA